MPTEFRLPDLGEGVEHADVVNVLVKPGDTVAVDQTLLEVETDKAGLDVPADFAGAVAELRVKPGDTVAPGQVILTYEASDGQPAPPQPEPAAAEAPAVAAEPVPAEEPVAAPEPEPEPAPAEAGAQPVFASPSVRRFAREIGVDIYQVKGTGAGGRISIDDVKEHARTVRAEPVTGGAPGAEYTREPMTRVRRATALQMSVCWDTVPHVTLFDQVDITDLEALRQRYKKRAEEAGGRLTLTVLLLRLVATALRQSPSLNASIEGETILYHHRRNVGIAVDTDRGLVVPVVRDADQKSILALSTELVELGEKAHRGKLAPDDLRGGTFTISNLGALGVGHFTPIVNHPQVGILGVGAATQQPVWSGEAFVPRLLLPLSLSIDHRLVDGADGARFLGYLRDLVEHPLLLALEG